MKKKNIKSHVIAPPPYKSRCLKAFTLAEVLITLAIIGVVAALTIPSVVANYQHTQYISGLKKAQSIMNSAVYMYIAQGGKITCDYNGDGRCVSNDRTFIYQASSSNVNVKFSVFDGIKENLTIINSSDNSYLDKQIFDVNGNVTTLKYKGALFLKDGMTIKFSFYNDAFSNPENADKNYILTFFVDVNGPYKKPNKIGYDIFAFFISNNGQVIPAGAKIGNHEEYCGALIAEDLNITRSWCTTNSALFDKDYWKKVKNWE